MALPLAPEIRAQVGALLRAGGQTAKAIAAEVGCSPTVVNAVARAEGIVLAIGRPRGPETEALSQEAIRLREEGLHVDEIARRLRRSARTIRLYLSGR